MIKFSTKVVRIFAITWCIVIYCLFYSQAVAKNDSLTYWVNPYYAIGSADFLPHWIVSNRYGIFENDQKWDALILTGARYPFTFGKKFTGEVATDILLSKNVSESYFHQLYFSLKYGSLEFKLGKEAYTIGQYNDDIGVGSFFISNNNRPIPRIGLGFYEYTTIPILKKYLEFKGAVNFGYLHDDRSPLGIEKPYFHEKFLYLKTRKLPVNPHIGITHNALMGGTRPNGEGIPVDLLATFFAMGSEKVGSGESFNVAGAHTGLYDIGLSWNIKDFEFQAYYQIPIEDGSSQNFLTNNDQIAGLLLSSNKFPWISGVMIQYVNTKHQGGPGLTDPDPSFHGAEFETADEFMFHHFDTVTIGWTQNQATEWMEDKFNYGFEYGGRDNYYNNYLYQKGFSFHNYAIGTSLFTGKDRMLAIIPDFDAQYDRYFVNNRVKALHLGFEGSILSNLSYRSMITLTKNWGTYAGVNKGLSNWESMNPDSDYEYFFGEGLKQSYSLLEMKYTLKKVPGLEFTGAMAYDFGEIYYNVGFMAALRYNGFVRFGKKD